MIEPDALAALPLRRARGLRPGLPADAVDAWIAASFAAAATPLPQREAALRSVLDEQRALRGGFTTRGRRYRIDDVGRIERTIARALPVAVPPDVLPGDLQLPALGGPMLRATELLRVDLPRVGADEDGYAPGAVDAWLEAAIDTLRAHEGRPGSIRMLAADSVVLRLPRERGGTDPDRVDALAERIVDTLRLHEARP